MVKAFHQAGIFVVLDVVYNHTCEGDHLGPIDSDQPTDGDLSGPPFQET